MGGDVGLHGLQPVSLTTPAPSGPPNHESLNLNLGYQLSSSHMMGWWEETKQVPHSSRCGPASTHGMHHQ